MANKQEYEQIKVWRHLMRTDSVVIRIAPGGKHTANVSLKIFGDRGSQAFAC